MLIQVLELLIHKSCPLFLSSWPVKSSSVHLRIFLIMRFEFQGYLIPLWILALPHHSCFTEPTFGVNHWYKLAFPCGSVVKNPPANTGDMGLIPGSRSFPWERKWQHIPIFLPGKILWTEEPRGLQSVGSQRVGYDWVNLYLITNVLSFWRWFIKIM